MHTPLMRLLRLLVSGSLVCSSASGWATTTEGDLGTLARAASPKSARASVIIEEDGPQLRATLLTTNTPTPRVGVLFELEPGWHIYWRNPGETGLAPSLEFSAERHRVAEVAWPAPEIFREADGLFTTYGYADRVLLGAVIQPLDASDVVAGSGTVRANVSVLACRTQCVPASFALASPLRVDRTQDDQAAVDRLFDEAGARLPIDAASLGIDFDAHWVDRAPEMDETAQVEVRASACRSSEESCRSASLGSVIASFIPQDHAPFEFKQTGHVLDREASEPQSIALQATRVEAGDGRLRGLVEVRGESGRVHPVAIDIPIRVPTLQSSSPVWVSVGTWPRILLLAMLGGLILNGMPCVLPVLAIKVVAVANLFERDPREVRLHGLAYTGGVLASMALLAAVVIGLRAAGHSVGWGFQFQEPLFVAAISCLLVAFALNLFGVFEIEFGQGRLAQIGQDSSGLERSAFEGLLAVVLATPCTAPFLGTAVGFAFATSNVGIAMIFLMIGLGLASPFLLVSFFPRLARFIPRSGPWMLKLRAGLGFSLLATVVWLLWMLGQTGGAAAVVAMVGELLVLAFLLWGLGQVQPIQSAWLARATAALIVCIAFVGFNLIDFDPSTARKIGPDEIDSMETGESDWRPYSHAAVEEVLAAGRPAFVVFTADWCMTCKFNERTVLDRTSVRAAFEANGVVLFKADWTRRDESIRKKLAEFDRAGVPLYLVYSPDAPDDPQVLSELLSQREVIAALDGPQSADRS